MKIPQYIIGAALAVAVLCPTNTQAKGSETQQIHMFGFAASFNDTIVHFTNIQTIDSAWIDRKSDFLLGRQLYSNMLRDYLDKNKMPHRTCIVVYDKSLKKLQKKYLKMRKLYLGTDKKGKKNKNRNIVKDIVESDFKFTAVNMNPEIENQQPEQGSAQKKKKK